MLMFTFLENSLSRACLIIAFLVFFLRLLSITSLFCLARRIFRSFVDGFYSYQFFRVPQFNENSQENQLYRKVSKYLNSLPTVEDSEYTILFTGNKPNEINLLLDANQTVADTFLSARLTWTNLVEAHGQKTYVLKVRRCDKRRILRPYLQHIHSIWDEFEQRRKEVKLYVNAKSEPSEKGRWTSIPFTHPSTFETVVMDSGLKNRIRSDLELFLKSKQYYHRLGRVWKRSYLLYGSSGTGKTSFVAAMAKVLCYDIYDVDLSRLPEASDLNILLMQTTNKSLILVEDLDRYLKENSTAVRLSGVLNFMDGIVSCCGEQRVMVFTMSDKDAIERSALRPGRIDVHIHFPACDFSGFKTLASSHLGLQDHKLFPQVEEIFQNGASLSQAEIGELMISNRSSPSRALRSIITALRTSGNKIGRWLGESGSGRFSDESGDSAGVRCGESINSAKDFRKLYGLLRLRSSRKDESPDLGSADKEGSRRGT